MISAGYGVAVDPICGDSASLPCMFPQNRELSTETGSLVTVRTTTQSGGLGWFGDRLRTIPIFPQALLLHWQFPALRRRPSFTACEGQGRSPASSSTCPVSRLASLAFRARWPPGPGRSERICLKPVRCPPQDRFGSTIGSILKNEIRGLFSDHGHRGVCVSGNDGRHDRCVRDAQSANAAHL